MHIIWRYIRPLRWWVVLSLVLAGVAQILTLVDPLIFGMIVDEYVLNPDNKPDDVLVRGAVWWLFVAAAVALAARFAKAFQDFVLALVVQKFGMQIFNDGLRQTLRLSFQEFEDRSSGEAVATLQKVRTDTERFINAFVNILFSSLVGISFLLWYGITKHWLLIPVFVVGVLVLGGLTGLLSQKMKAVQRMIVRETAKMSGSITESLRNIELVKSLGLTYPEIRRLQLYTKKIFDLEMDKVKRVRSLSFLQGTLINLLKQSILFILLWLIFRKTLTAGELISMQFILNTIFVPLQDLGKIILNYREAQASMQMFDELMKKPVETRPEAPVDIGELESLRFDDVVFKHRTATENAIDHLSFQVRLGDTVAFVGPSGSGKSTLVKLLVGLYTPISGTIYMDGVPVKELRYNPIRRQIGFVTQDPQLFSGTIRENLLFVKPEATDEEMHEALERASATTLLERSGKGLETRLGESGLRVSGGERQRLSIARALLRHPRLFIFDEATSALDSITEQEITSAIREVSSRKEHMVILIAHRLSTVMHADTIHVLEKGRIIESGTHEALLENKGLYYAMWRQQIGERDARLIRSVEEIVIDEPEAEAALV
ncbi:ABC transporter ATP-binding protein [candidate division KSB1 bacterium]|nr:MAG: ABC transporter ATP-binding protein [candidate division KSB1 bacterium]